MALLWGGLSSNLFFIPIFPDDNIYVLLYVCLLESKVKQSSPIYSRPELSHGLYPPNSKNPCIPIAFNFTTILSTFIKMWLLSLSRFIAYHCFLHFPKKGKKCCLKSFLEQGRGWMNRWMEGWMRDIHFDHLSQNQALLLGLLSEHIPLCLFSICSVSAPLTALSAQFLT